MLKNTDYSVINRLLRVRRRIHVGAPVTSTDDVVIVRVLRYVYGSQIFFFLSVTVRFFYFAMNRKKNCCTRVLVFFS